MGLLEKAVETYDCFAQEAGIVKENETPLAPISHIITNAEIEITIDQDGSYLSGRLVDKKEPKIIIPATEDSAGRTSAPCAHPLCDQLGYVADYEEKKHSLYKAQLKEWLDFDKDNPKLQAVYRYVERGTILKDLADDQIIHVNEKGLPEKDKLMIRWRIENGEEESACWKDRKLFDSFIRFYAKKRDTGEKRLCMISGKMETPARQHPKGIIPINGNAKLISANDKSGFTYRGRFGEDWQSATVGYEASQKAHNALRWIAANQGVRRAIEGSPRKEWTDGEKNHTVYGGRTFLCWNPQGMRIPPTPLALLWGMEEKQVKFSDYRQALQRVIDGYRGNLPEDAGVVIVAFDAATTGRLAVTYYNELRMSDFLERLKYWDETCCWRNGVYGIQSPSLYLIVQYAYGTPREEKMAAPKDGIVRQQLQRVISCRIDGKMMPRDIFQNLVQKASKQHLYEKNTRAQLVFVTCAVIRKYYWDVYKEEIPMGLDKKNQDINYLFGRLLAVAEKTEEDTYGRDERRETNAIRYQPMFVQRPLDTWEMLEDRLRPYRKRLRQNNPGLYIKYEKITDEIFEMLPADREICNKSLNSLYMIGYRHQKQDFYTGNKEKAEETAEGTE